MAPKRPQHAHGASDHAEHVFGERQCWSTHFERPSSEGTWTLRVRFHSSAVLPGSHEVLRGLRGGPGWFEVRLYEGFRVSRAVGPEVSQGSTKLCKDSKRVPQGSTMLHQACVVRPSSEKPSDQDRFAHGRNTKQNRNQWFLAHFHCFVTCSLAQANVGFVANQITSQLTVQQSKCLALLLGGSWVPRIPRGCEGYEVKHQILQKLWGSPEERFQQSFTLSSTKVA